MGTLKDSLRRAGACVLAVTMIVATVPPVAARDEVLGTITATGTAFASSATSDWAKITATRPLVSGDRLKTNAGAGLVADFHELGIIGLYGDSEISVVEKGAEVTVNAQRGKVAFHLAPKSRLKLAAGGATISAGARKAEGYVEFDEVGTPQLVVESEDLSLVPAGGSAKIAVRGERIVLEGAAAAPTVATVDERKASAVPPPPDVPRRKVAGLSPLGWTAIAAAVAAVGIGVGVGVSGGGGGGGGDDNNGSE